MTEFSSTTFVAGVYCSAMYAKVLYVPTPSRPSTTTGFQARRSSGHCRRRCGSAKGSVSSSDTTQRQKANASGGTSARMARPSTILPDQNNAVSVSSR